MFEQELEMEKKSSSIVPLMLIVTLIVGIAGVALYFVLWSRTEVSAAEANAIVTAALERQGPATLKFETGMVSDQTQPDPRYRLLEKEGYVKLGKTQKNKTPITLTEKGESFLGEIAGVQEKKTDDGKGYTVPLAQRKLVSVDKITMLSPEKAQLDYTWKWEPTKGGEVLDAAGPAVKKFNTWDRSTLIDKFGAAFYSASPTKVTILVAKKDKGWTIVTQ